MFSKKDWRIFITRVYRCIDKIYINWNWHSANFNIIKKEREMQIQVLKKKNMNRYRQTTIIVQLISGKYFQVETFNNNKYYLFTCAI